MLSASPAHPTLTSVFEAFDRRGVRWCLLRFPADLSAPSGDIDLLISRADRRRVRHLLTGLGFVQLPAWTHGRQAFFVSYHLSTARWIFLHVVTDLRFGPDHLLPTGAATMCLARRRRSGSIAVLAPGDAFWALLLHCLLDKRAVAPHHRERLQGLATAAPFDSPLACAVGARCPPGWLSDRLVQAVQAGEWSELARLAPALLASWKRHDRIGARHRWLARGLRLVDRVAHLWHRRGLSVALLGPDGAGKSTLAMGIRDGFVFPARLIYMGLHTPRLLRLDRLRSPPLVVPGRLAVLWSRYLLARYHLARGRLVIFDRYTFDAFIPTHEQLARSRRCYRWIDAHACPAPDLVFVLDVGGDIMFDRKGHHKYRPEHLETARQHYLALRQRLPKLQVVDATRPKEEMRAEVIALIWHRYAARLRGGV